MSGADILIEPQGTIVLLRACTALGRDWLARKVHPPGWANFSGAIACEPRYVLSIASGAIQDGLVVG
jgi:hypothetical protein